LQRYARVGFARVIASQRICQPAFFRRCLEAAPRDALDITAPHELADGPGAIA